MYLSRMNYAATHGVGMSEGEQSKWVRVKPERVNHDKKNGSNAASSWFLNSDAHGIIRSTIGATMCSCACAFDDQALNPPCVHHNP